MRDDDERRDAGAQPSLEAFLAEEPLSEGQRRRVALFRRVEGEACARIEAVCASSGIDVADVAVLVVDASARDLLFPGQTGEGAVLIVGHRDEVRAILRSALPPADDAPFDPYEDLRSSAPASAVRVLIVERGALTVMSYGMFVTVQLSGAEVPDA